MENHNCDCSHDVTRIEEQIEALDRLLSTKIEERDRRVNVAMDAAERASKRAREAYDRRLELLNEFRGQSADEAKKYALREVVNGRFVALEDRFNKLHNALSNLQGRAVMFASGGAIIGAVITAIIMAAIL